MKPTIITNDANFTQLKNHRIKSTDCFDLSSNICLYAAFIFNILIAGGGVVLCAINYSVGSTQNWKIGGIVMGILVCLASWMMIYISIFKRTNTQPRTYKHEEILVNNEYLSNDDIDQLINYTHSEEDFHNGIINQTPDKAERRKRDTSSSPIPNPAYPPLVTFNNDAVFCPGCNRSHPSAHKCLYFNKTAQTTKDIMLSQVSLPKAEVLLRQPRTKIMIVRVPKGAGQLVIQPKKDTR